MHGSSLFFLFATLLTLLFPDANLLAQGGQSKTQRQSSQTAHGLSKPKTAIDVRLPADVDKPVLMFDYVGGYRMKDPAGFEPTPLLQIFSDGKILAGRKSNLVVEVEGKIDVVSLQQLLVFAADDCRFFDITSEMLKSDIEANTVARIMDAPTTVLEIRLQKHTNRISAYGLPYGPGKLAKVPSVAATLAIVSRCKRLIATTKLGSVDESDAAIAAINEALSRKSPDTPEFTLAHLQSAERFTDGRRSASFVQNFSVQDKSMMAYATLETSADGNSSVNVDVVTKTPRGR